MYVHHAHTFPALTHALLSHSPPSQLVGGLAFGAMFAGAGYLISNVDAYRGHMLGCVSSAALTAVMGMRFSKSGKMMPAGNC